MKIEAKTYKKPTPHLGDTMKETGAISDEAAWINNEIILKGLRANHEKEQAERAAQGKALKLNPHISDVRKCLRKVVYSLMNKEGAPFTTDSLMNFMVGHAVEEAMASICAMRGATLLREVRVEIPAGNTVVSGRVDFLLELNEENGSRAILELKSTSSRAMSMMLKNGEKGKDEHRGQLNLYIHASQKGLLPQKYDHGYLVYIVKDAIKGEPVAHAWRVNYDEHAALNDLAGLAGAKACADGGLLPNIPSEYGRTKFPCSYCDFRNLCWGA
jgi:hypothetical protein